MFFSFFIFSFPSAAISKPLTFVQHRLRTSKSSDLRVSPRVRVSIILWPHDVRRGVDLVIIAPVLFPFFFPTALMMLMQQCVPPLSHKCLSVQVLLSFINSLTLKESRRRTALSRRWGMSWISVHAVFLLVPVRRCNIAATFIVSTTAVSSCLW